MRTPLRGSVGSTLAPAGRENYAQSLAFQPPARPPSRAARDLKWQPLAVRGDRWSRLGSLGGTLKLIRR
jgi:hypothetical protein